jgi:hypothetical protein
MAITFLPTRTEGSGPEDLGQAKADASAYNDPTVQLAAVNFNNLADFLIALGAEVGLTDGSTVGSLRADLIDLDADLDAHVGVGGVQHPNAVAAGAAGFMSGADKTKLDGIEALADVTDAANVAAAGAAMRTPTVTLDAASFTLQTSDEILKVDTTSAPVQITLYVPAAARSFMVQKVAGGVNKITLVRAGSEQIMGTGANYDLPGSAVAFSASAPQAWLVWTDGTNWFVA